MAQASDTRRQSLKTLLADIAERHGIDTADLTTTGLREKIWRAMGKRNAPPNDFLTTIAHAREAMTHVAQGDLRNWDWAGRGTPGQGTSGGVRTTPGDTTDTTTTDRGSPGQGTSGGVATPAPTTAPSGPFAPVGIGGAPSTSMGLFNGGSLTYEQLMNGTAAAGGTTGHPGSTGAGGGTVTYPNTGNDGRQGWGGPGGNPFYGNTPEANAAGLHNDNLMAAATQGAGVPVYDGRGNLISGPTGAPTQAAVDAGLATVTPMGLAWVGTGANFGATGGAAAPATAAPATTRPAGVSNYMSTPGQASYAATTSAAPATQPQQAQTLTTPDGRQIWSGPNGEGGYAPWDTNKPANAQPFQMPDGRTAYYVPGSAPQAGNVAALTAYSNANGDLSGANSNLDAKARLQSVLEQYGLGSLADWAYQKLVNGESQDAILQDLRQTDQYKDRFPGMAQRQAAGLPAISEGEYLAYEKSAISMMRAAGLPSGFYDQPTDLSNFIGADVSLTELSERVGIASEASLTAPQAVRDELATLYGIGTGDLTAYFLDPTRAEPLLKQRYAAAGLGAQGTTTGYGQLGAGQLEGLAAAGVTDATAQKGFGQLASQRELFGALPGEAGASGFTTDEQLAAEFYGNAGVQQRIERQAANRVAAFGGSSSFAGTNQGASGIGAAQGA